MSFQVRHPFSQWRKEQKQQEQVKQASNLQVGCVQKLTSKASKQVTSQQSRAEQSGAGSLAGLLQIQQQSQRKELRPRKSPEQPEL